MYGEPNRARSVYVRWGSKSCPNANDLVYSGVVGGGDINHHGSAGNPLCLPRDPIYDNQQKGTYDAYLYGAEYQIEPHSGYDLDVVCAVCIARSEVTVMFPARNACYSGWKFQYSGHLMSGYYKHSSPSEYVCMDSAMEADHGSVDNKNGKLFYYVISKCGSLPCPPYEENKVVTCVVCSK